MTSAFEQKVLETILDELEIDEPVALQVGNTLRRALGRLQAQITAGAGSSSSSSSDFLVVQVFS